MEALELKGMTAGLDEVEKGVKKEAKNDYNHLLKMKEIFWRQKLRVT